MYALIFYVPQTHAEQVKKALFAKGAGRYNNYDSCCWQVPGQGQFRPLKGSAPFLGKQGTIEHVTEYKVEMICDDAVVGDVLEELIKVHPYQEPAYAVWKVQTYGDTK